MKSEAEIQAEIQIHAVQIGSILMRNNSGAFQDVTGRWVYYGLGNISKKHSETMKSSDLIGITTITITPDMVGTKIGVFTACEVKKEDWTPSPTDKREKAQQNLIDWVRSRGGFAIMTNSIDRFKESLRR